VKYNNDREALVQTAILIDLARMTNHQAKEAGE